ncbi:hypothetical protein [Secundilactobacillus yichangensis]|uniref:hypothetical protein n=1 Tax=Secundilactobacillus yichangensis TaxID=2799580 RepID=UPI001941FA75|nr:hypothetical protein [Secundilactobacillus yichangensis]
MRFRKLVTLGITTLSLGTAGAALAQPVEAHAATAIPARFRHNWKYYGDGHTIILRMHKYSVSYYDGNKGYGGSWEKRYYKKASKNHYYVLAPKRKTEQGMGVKYVNSHKLHLEYDVSILTMHRY